MARTVRRSIQLDPPAEDITDSTKPYTLTALTEIFDGSTLVGFQADEIALTRSQLEDLLTEAKALLEET